MNICNRCTNFMQERWEDVRIILGRVSYVRIDAKTKTLISTLENTKKDPMRLVQKYLQDVFQMHGYNINSQDVAINDFENRIRANEKLNPPLLKQLEKLSLQFPSIQRLYNKACQPFARPLSALVKAVIQVTPLTKQLEQDLKSKDISEHNKLLKAWVVAAYKTEQYIVSRDRGGHGRDVHALDEADHLFNPILIEHLADLKSVSIKAQELYDKAIRESKPLSEIVCGKKFISH